jgi:hypothetical protein
VRGAMLCDTQRGAARLRGNHRRRTLRGVTRSRG